ncbi:mannitol-1-phosphate/altronate dehydrogenase [Novosphingobium sp. SG751A]|uniref:mannitol dehydrogenase family protein n=1 Tax=Novosphingobium sp. SG751A TaxID=2587000 RepID=UPI00155525DF|nr:mannitol dehydrogenase family protein [Novosphingobium sp. SG751A]NOW44989.1 mannitol-1-phosphate/altronate dehydrogenase [Novosphingobium sp. SG751A]
MNEANLEPMSRRAPGTASGITIPRYDMTAVAPGIVHIGLGGFHRAHFARYTHDLMEVDQAALRWGIIGAGLRATDIPLLETLNQQDGLFTLIERDLDGETHTLVGSIIRAVDASKDSTALLDAIAGPLIRIVSITVSEHGYHLDSATRRLNFEDPAIKRDLSEPQRPLTLIGILVESFRRRRDQDRRPFTALSCDNIHDNGRVLRAAILAYAERVDADLAAWIDENCRFPCSMVDRITPVPSADQRREFQEQSGSLDQAPIFAESFRQWVLEDEFSDGRPDWDRVGAQFVTNVSPYEKMKLRLLNASHLATAGLGTLAGYDTVRETIEDPFIRRYMERLMESETGPTLPPVPGIDLAVYQRTLVERFANPAIHDKLQRINADAPLNLLLDPLRDRMAIGGTIDLLSLGLAAWLKRVKVEAALPTSGRPMGKSEEQLQQLSQTIADPALFLDVSEIFGDLGSDPRLKSSIRHWLTALDNDGAIGVLQSAARTGLL